MVIKIYLMELTQCPACRIDTYENSDFCDNCIFPFKGTEKEKSIHIDKFISKKGIVRDSSDAVGNVRKILFALAALNVLSVFVLYSGDTYHLFDLVLNVFLALVFVFCAILVKKAPLLFTALPLTILLCVYILNAIIDPVSLLSGSIIKVLILGSLIYSILLSLKAKRFQKQFKIG